MIIKTLEKHLQTFLEGHLAHFVDGGVQPHMIAQRLTSALETNRRDNLVPDQFVVALQGDVLAKLLPRYASLSQELEEQLYTLVETTHLHMNFYPQVILVGDDTLASHEVRVRASYRQSDLTATQELDQFEATPAQTIPQEAHLIVDSQKQFPLGQNIVNIGRHTDNHIILEGTTISRQHCQIRLRFGHYVLYDLQSKAGTFVNGQRIHEHRLQTGDVIDFGGVQIVYVEYSADRDAGDTQRDINFHGD